MNAGILYIVLLVVGVFVGIALVWFLVELVLTLRKTRSKVDEVQELIGPTIKNVEKITDDIKPSIKKIDPLLERLSLTIDAANLEIMRADQILENVNVVTEGLADATTTVTSIANAPAELLGKAGEKVQSLFTGKKKSNKLDSANIAGALSEADSDIDKITKQAKKQGKLFGRKIKKKSSKFLNSSSNDPYTNIN